MTQPRLDKNVPARPLRFLRTVRWELVNCRKRVEITGTVQGVGFRPFVYRLANQLDLKGHVLNVSGGVTIEIEGPEAAVRCFLDRLKTEAPPLSEIGRVTIEDQAPLGDRTFTIHHSVADISNFAMVPPDIATCGDCVADFTDPANRRFLYPFTNCTSCGPRYTLIQDIPYDRPQTTMAVFPMCAECQREYDDPADRRFHAQPNACPVCGPKIWLDTGQEGREALNAVRDLLKGGAIVAIKGLGGFHLACDAENDAAVHGLRERKRRSDKAFALMVRDVFVAEQIAEVTEADWSALTSFEHPVVLLPRRAGASISDAVAPGNRSVGIMLPYTPLHRLLFDDSLRTLVMTSGNLSEEPIVSRNEDAVPRLRALADRFLYHNRDIQTRVDDSVVRTFEGKTRTIRRSRGYAPHPIERGRPIAEVLGCGGELKNTFCLTKGTYAILSQHIGDLENLETLTFFRETLDHMQRFFRVAPCAVGYDLHPGYMSSKFARELPDIEKIGVQHHHAHVASCMAENHVSTKTIGVAFDGTGYGTDGKIWGGEFLLADFAGFERRAHFRYVALVGGDSAVRHPWRVALSFLRDAFGNGPLPDLPMFHAVPANQVRFVDAAIARRINSVETSSCGRLFDAVSAIAGVRLDVNYEGQAAIELEMSAAPSVEESYPFEVESSAPWQIDTRPLIRAVVKDVIDRRGAGVIAAKFHNAVADVVLEIARRIRAAEHVNRVCLTGGTFQNVLLLTRSVQLLRGAGFEVLLHSAVPANDGGLALGQALIAAEMSGLSRGSPALEEIVS